MRDAALAAVFAFGIFANNYPVEGGGIGGTRRERRGCAGKDACRSDIDVLVQGFADWEDEAPKGDVVGYICGCSSALTLSICD